MTLAGLFNRLLPVGRRSLLWGVHQFLWHPVTVWLAWVILEKQLPTWRESICIIIHDWGHWFCHDMDGPEGSRHPEFGAKLAGRWFGPTYWDLVLYHSRHYARNAGKPASVLCWADKYSIMLEPWWWYLPRAMASGEIHEYRRMAALTGFIPPEVSNREWFMWVKNRLATLGRERRADVVQYQDGHA